MIGQRDLHTVIEAVTIEVAEAVMEEEVVVVMVVEGVEEAHTAVAEEEAVAVTVVVAQALGVVEGIAPRPVRVVEADPGLRKIWNCRIFEGSQSSLSIKMSVSVSTL